MRPALAGEDERAGGIVATPPGYPNITPPGEPRRLEPSSPTLRGLGPDRRKTMSA